jgi:tetratricopeptide (TPR) repeat protein
MPRESADDVCPREEDIAAFVRGRLPPHRRRALEAHVVRCSACRRLLSALAHAEGADSHPAVDTVSPTLQVESRGGETELTPGARVGRYAVLDWLGSGGMGVVYSAYDPELNRKVALKVLRNEGGAADRLPIHDVLLREAQAMAQLAHPNVVAVFDVGSVDDRVFIAMELVEGLTLAKWLAAERRTHGEIIATFMAAGSGLAAAHAAGLIHRDFKPDNVLIGHDGRVRVTDFGLARPVLCASVETAQRSAEPGHGTSAPQTGLAGTLAYMAPEQYLRRTADARADQFSFAVALYEALYGERPFAPLEFATPHAAPSQAVAPPRSGVPAAMRQALVRALSPDPERRFPTMVELLAALAPRPRRGRALAVAAIAVVITAVASAGGYSIHLTGAAEQRTQLVGRLRGLVPGMRTLLRNEHMLPAHDIRPTLEEVRSQMRDVERQRHTPAGRTEIALIDFVLGEGHRGLGEYDRALALLAAAWAAGERGPDIEEALGDVLGATYSSKRDEIEAMVQSDRRDALIRDIEQRYRDPAMAHLRAALATRPSLPAYLEALIAFHEHRFADASARAHAAFTAAPSRYEAGVLEARAHHEAGRQLQAADKRDEATAEYAAARVIFERVLEIARSDDHAWHDYAVMVHTQAIAVARGPLPADLKDRTIAALRTVRKINPDHFDATLLEAGIYQQEANIAILGYRDPGPYVEQALKLADEARAQGANPDQVDVLVCLAHWERAVYQGSHGIDPHAAFEQAIAACESAAATKRNADEYAALGSTYLSLAAYDAEHGRDPIHAFELGERHLRTAISIDDDDAVLHYNLARLWTKLAHYQQSHGVDPERAVDRALRELTTAERIDASRADTWCAMSDALIARARFQHAQRQRFEPALREAHAVIERALAIEPTLVAAIRYRIMLAELEAEALLERRSSPAAAVGRMREQLRELSRRQSEDGFVHRFACRAELLAARWALVNHRSVDRFLIRATAEAARARAADPMDVQAWIASAEVEQVRAEAARLAGGSPAVATASGLAFAERALQIDPRRVRARELHSELVRRAHPMSWPTDPASPFDP